MSKFYKKSGNTTPNTGSGTSLGQGSSDPQQERQSDTQKDALGILKTSLGFASNILSFLPVQAPKNAVDLVKQLVTDFEARPTLLFAISRTYRSIHM